MLFFFCVDLINELLMWRNSKPRWSISLFIMGLFLIHIPVNVFCLIIVIDIHVIKFQFGRMHYILWVFISQNVDI